ncbi:MAG: HEPN domain-containing protein [Desulfuromonadales bacterium]|nr:HEPN domain-containing protein [Desulfuromonadales bacterium]
MTPEKGFEAAIARANHLIKLYELICDTRKRSVKDQWSEAFKKVMRWPVGEGIIRVDGKEKKSILVFRESCGIDRSHFAHNVLSELLRSSVVASVSAIDRLVHDLVVKHSWKLLTRADRDIPPRLKKLHISVFQTKKAIEHLRKDGSSRPGNLIKSAIQEQLHRDFTFQSPNAILEASKLLGIANFWSEVASHMPGVTAKKAVIDELELITRRRNQIVHEADLVRTKRHEARLRDISLKQAVDTVTWIASFGKAISQVVSTNVK